MIITGKVSQIIYRNENNGYTVFLIKSEGEYITAVGETAQVEPGDEFELERRNYISQILRRTICIYKYY